MEVLMLVMVLAVLNNDANGPVPEKGVPVAKRLAACPDKPNCVSSRARDTKHAVAPMRLKEGAVGVWATIRETVSGLPRCTIVKATDRYLHATCKSRLFGFTDDLEMRLEPDTGIVDIRSAARSGYSDFGVNRKRVEGLRSLLKEKALIE